MTISFTIPGLAAPAGSKRGFIQGGRVRIVDANKNAAAWKADVREAAARAYDGKPLTGPLRLHVVFSRPRPRSHFGAKGTIKPSAPTRPTTRPDVTKLLRGLEDALTGIVWADDSQITSQAASKRYGDPQTSVVITELP